MEQINQSSIYTLRQLAALLEQLSPSDYALPLDVLKQNSIGKHVRHLLEIYQALFTGLAVGRVDYDNRARDLQLETDPYSAQQTVSALMLEIQNSTRDSKLTLAVNQSFKDECHLLVESSFARELMYCLEHAIHHMAIIAIAVRTAMAHIELHPHFGVAYSTIRHLEQTPACVQ